jgi:hypothetical protein
MKKILNYIAGFFFTAILILAGYAFSTKATFDLDKAYKFEGTVSEKQSNKYFKIKLDEISSNFYIYRASRDYSDLEYKIQKGEKIKVYVAHLGKKNTELIQVEKEGQIIFNSNEFYRKYIFVSIFCFIGGLITFFMTIKVLIKKHVR